MAVKIPSSLADLVEKMRADLHGRSHISLAEIEVAQVTAVDWRDSSLGCPQPGMRYLMVITPGYEVVLLANGRSFTYHTNGTRFFVFCPGNTQQPPASDVI